MGGFETRPWRPEPYPKSMDRLASITFGFSLGFGFLVVWHAIKQTRRARNKFSTYIILIWLELGGTIVEALLVYLFLLGVCKHSFFFYFAVLVSWTIQVQCLLHIIVNRICILIFDAKQRVRLKLGTLMYISLINISVFCIWIPSRLQISSEWERINNIWDRIEKVLYLGIDVTLNLMFIRIIKKKLVDSGITKYDRLVRFNKKIMIFSVFMDLLIIGMMFLPNSFVYTQFQALAYLVKLNIEMSMSDLMITVANTSVSGSGETRMSPLHSCQSGIHVEQRTTQVSELDPYLTRRSEGPKVKGVDTKRGHHHGHSPHTDIVSFSLPHQARQKEEKENDVDDCDGDGDVSSDPSFIPTDPKTEKEKNLVIEEDRMGATRDKSHPSLNSPRTMARALDDLVRREGSRRE